MTNRIGQTYVQANAGILRNADESSYFNNGITIGTQQKLLLGKKDALVGSAQVGAGTAIQAKMQLGYEREIGKNLGLQLTANASIDKSLTNVDTFVYTADSHITVNNQKCDISTISATAWKPGQIKFSGKAVFDKTTSWGNYQFGLEGGYRKSLSPDISGVTKLSMTTPEFTKEETANFGRKAQEEAYVTPTVSAAVNLKKNSSFQLTGHADVTEAQVGIRYNF